MLIRLISSLLLTFLLSNFLYAGEEKTKSNEVTTLTSRIFCSPNKMRGTNLLLNNPYENEPLLNYSDEMGIKEKIDVITISNFMNKKLMIDDNWKQRNFTSIFEELQKSDPLVYSNIASKLVDIDRCNNQEEKEGLSNDLMIQLASIVLSSTNKKVTQLKNDCSFWRNRGILVGGCGGATIVAACWFFFLLSVSKYYF